MGICISGVTLTSRLNGFCKNLKWLVFLPLCTIFVSRSLLCYSILHDPLRLNYRKLCWQNPSCIWKFYNQTDTKMVVQNSSPCFLGIHEKRRGKKVAKGVPVGLFLLQEKKSHRHVASIGQLRAIHIWSSIKFFQVYIINKLEKCYGGNWKIHISDTGGPRLVLFFGWWGFALSGESH